MAVDAGVARHLLLVADLGRGCFERVAIDPALVDTWLGGRGLAGCFLRPRCSLPWDHDEMPVIVMAGPLAGTAAPASGRACFMSRSPLTGTVGDSSAGGSFAIQLRRAGLTGIVLTGRSERLCGLEIEDGVARLVDARDLADRDTVELFDLLKGRGSVALTGPAAGNGVLYSSIMIDGIHAAGRNGLGLAFAARNLKYISVRGTGSVRVADPARLSAACAEIRRLLAASPVVMGAYGLHNMGTGALYDLMHARGMMPTANFRRTSFEAAPSMNASVFARLHDTRRTGCEGCGILCKRVGRDGVHMPEFETMSHFSALLENEDISVVTEANSLCTRSGMDTISAGSTLACHSEIIGRRLPPGEILDLLRGIAMGEQPGLGSGSRRYAGAAGRPEASMSVKSLELPAYDPRGAYGMALAYAVATRGGCHLRAYPISHEILRRPVVTDRLSFSGKARIIKIAEDANAAVDSIGACRFSFFGASLEEYAEALSAVTGRETTAQDLLDAGEKITFRDRMMNSLCGFSKADDDLPSRFFTEPGSPGPWQDIDPIPREGFLEARSRYYRIRGLDSEGAPLASKASELGLADGKGGA